MRTSAYVHTLPDQDELILTKDGTIKHLLALNRSDNFLSWSACVSASDALTYYSHATLVTDGADRGDFIRLVTEAETILNTYGRSLDNARSTVNCVEIGLDYSEVMFFVVGVLDMIDSDYHKLIQALHDLAKSCKANEASLAEDSNRAVMRFRIWWD